MRAITIKKAKPGTTRKVSTAMPAKQEAAVKRVYRAYWDSYLAGNLRKFASLVDPVFQLIGTSESEVISGKAETLRWLKKTVKEIKGRAELRNRDITYSLIDGLVLVSEQARIFIRVKNKWKYYSGLRVSTLLRHTQTGWKVVQQHGSLPDTRTSEGETVSFETLSKDNLRLKEAVQRRTIELVEKNRELEIESALEKVRAVAMGMRRPDDMLRICKVISLQLRKLGVQEIRNVQTAIFYPGKGTYMNYQYYAKSRKTFITDTVYTDHKIPRAFAAKMLKGKGQVSVTHIEGKQKMRDWIRYQQGTNVFIDPWLHTTSSLHYYWYSLGPVALGISTYRRLSKEDEILFQRFLNVFELAYRRYLDIEKAEAQAREAEVEAALERVRARAMAMHNSRDLSGTVSAFFSELGKLGIETIRTGVAIYSVDRPEPVYYATARLKDNNELVATGSPHPSRHPCLAKQREAWVKQKNYFPVLYGAELRSYYKAISLKPFSAVKGKTPLQHKEYGYYLPFTSGNLYIWSLKAYLPDEISVLTRFKTVVDLTFKRYFDLEKAEMQARETQVQLALERVRARTMAMHKSDDLLDIIIVVAEQLRQLGIKFDNVSFGVNSPEYDMQLWMAVKGHTRAFRIQWSFLDNPGVTRLKEAQRNPDKVFADVLTRAENNEWMRHIFKCNPRLDIFTDEQKRRLLKTPGFARSLAVMKDIFLVIGNYAAIPYTEKENLIFKRFANVFEQAFTRFLDLQKAEAQAREAEIQLALERVRARTMAMQKSDELREVVGEFFRQVQLLGIEIQMFVIFIFKPEGGMEWWGTGFNDEGLPQSYDIPPLEVFTSYSRARNLIEIRKNKTPYQVFELSGGEKKNWDRFLLEKTGLEQLPARIKKGMRSLDKIVLCDSVCEHGILEVAGLVALSDEHEKILQRFTKVFEQTYTRFLDVQKAEIQAREAQIETSLERVRSRTMAMHRSEELVEVATLIHKELRNLGYPESFGAGYVKYDEENNIINGWLTDYEGKNQDPFNLPLKGDPLLNERYKAWKKLEPLLYQKAGGKELIDHFSFVMPGITSEQVRQTVEQQMGDPSHFYHSFFRHGALIAITKVPLDSEQQLLFQRFAKVFEQTYTRFLDLQKAEAQGREAQIQLALERVRARTMAMHKSNELPETSHILFEQMKELGEPAEQMSIGIVREELNIIEISATLHGDTLKKLYNHSIDEPYMMNKVYKAWKTNQKTLIVELKGKELNAYNKYRNKLTHSEMFPTNLGNDYRRIVYAAFFSKGMLALAANDPRPQSLELLERFASVFDLTYTRFLDLKKAEAQAREAEIELALERVRARTMSMHKSEELAETASVLFQQLIELDIKPVAFGFIIMNEITKSGEVFISADGTVIPDSFILPYHGEPAQDKIFNSWKKREPYIIVDLKGKKLETHLKFIAKNMPVFDMLVASGTTQPARLALHMINFRHGCLGINYPEPNEEVIPLLIRFAKVFEQTYTRFLDLQNAEAQTRESEIQLALERVRAKTMAMHKSEELQDVASLLYKEFQGLGVTSFLNCGYVEVDEEHKTQYGWMTSPDGTFMEKFHLPLTGEPAFQARYDAWKKQEPVYHQVIGGAALVKHIKVASRHFGSVEVEKMVKSQFPDPTIFYCGNFSKGYLHLVTGNLLTSDEESLLERFTRAFDMTYKRFLDLQKAEAQVREAQIEAALEKVRSRSLAMHKSGELSQVVMVLFEKLKELHIPVTAAGITTFLEGSKDMNVYVCGDVGKGLTINHYLLPYFDHRIANEYYDVYKKQLELFIGNYSKEEKNSFYKKVFKLEALKDLPVEVKNMVFKSDSYTVTMAGAKNSMLAVNNFAGEQLLQSEIEIVKRFAKVFDQAYIRFLDLQKAEAQAREAQVQLALERARAQSMMMQHSKELDDTLRVFHEQVLQLGIQSAFSFLWLPDEKHNRHIFWAIWAEKNLSVFKSKDINYSLDRNEPATAQCLNDWKTKQVVSYQVYPEGVESYFSAWSELIEGAEHLKPEYFRDGLYYVEAFIRYGCFGVLVKNDLSEDEKNILYRFAVEFERTYTRFLDLQKAEAQVREAQIEAALERIRSRSLAMHHSSELSSVVDTLLQEFTGLNFSLTFCIINLINGDDLSNTVWAANPETGKDAESYYMKFEDYDFHRAMWKAWKAQDKRFVYTLEGEEKRRYDEYLYSETEFRRFPKHVQEANKALEKYVAGFTFFKYSGLQTVSEHEITEAELEILERFGRVFEQAYTRFLDLQKAEAQAREAEIQLALERVRARSLAMHHTSELQEVVNIAAQQLHGIGMDINGGVFICINAEVDKELSIWASGGMADYVQKVIVPVLNKPIFTTVLDTIKKGNSFLIESFSDKEKRELFNHLFKHEPWKSLPQERKKELLSRKGGFARSVVISQYTSISVTNHHGKAFSEEENEILKRFGKVFEQSYIRFLDLQKAEAQAREAKIEAALEKVRSRTMAMQKSDELADVATVLFKELNQLVDNLWTCGFVLCERDRPEDEWWLCTEGGFIPAFYLPNVGDATHYNIYQGWLTGESYHTEQLEGESLKEHYDWLMTIPVAKKIFDDFAAAGYNRPEWQKLHCAYFSRGYLCIITREPCPAEEIFKRFAQVFDLTYTRFLDLQRAEAQAREAQVEAALERVRARSMAMHRSEELSDLSLELVKQVQALDVKTWFCAFNIYDDDPEGSLEWGSNGLGVFPRYRTPREGIFLRYYKAGQQGESLLIHAIGEEECPAHYAYLCSLPGVGEQLLKMKAEGIPFPASQIDHVAYFKYGYIIFITYEPVPEAHDVFKRFAKVFEQTYTRFLDLQKAEAQAREAQIEAALERVRSRSMAMHKSEELKEVIKLVLEQIGHLNINAEHAGFYIDYKANEDMHIWLADPNLEPFYAVIPYFDTPTWNSFLEAKTKGITLHTDLLDFETKNRFYTSLFKLFSVPEEAKEFYLQCKGLAVSTVLLDNVGLYIENFSAIPYTDEENKILLRFGKVFQQTYTRFLDLQKAEEQARESQIELSLERIRSQAMAMQQSADLLDIVVTMRNEFTSLGHEAHYFWYMRWLPEKYEKAMTSGDGTRIGMVMELPRHIHGDIPLLANWEKSDQPTVVFTMDTDAAIDYVDKMVRLGDFKQVDPHAPGHDDIRHIGGLTFIMARTMHGEIGYSLPGVVDHPPDEAVNTLKRFAGVFDLAYRRFEDLMVKEEKNREIQVELAMERVRTKTMAMQHSDELPEAANVLFLEVQKLGIPSWSCGYNILSEDKRSSTCIMSSEGQLQIPFTLPLTGHESFIPWYEAIVKNEEFFVNQQGGRELEEHYSYMKTLPELAPVFRQFDETGLSLPTFQINHLARFKQGFLLFITYEPVPEAHGIFKRFAKLFEQTYTRFLDLQKAEAQAREAQIEAALEKVRSRTLAMQHSEELPETSAIIFQQLIGLGISPNRLYISIIKNDDGDAEFWITDEDGTKVSMAYEDNLHSNASFKKMYNGWKQEKKSLVIDMKGKELEDYFEHLNNIHVPFKGGLDQKRRLQYLAYFSKGFIGMASPDEQPEETLQLLERFAYVFNLTFTRFNDLKIAEAHALQAEHDLVEIKAARKKAEETLAELQAAQKQLVQSEKMASLGELTAGIAHEIQNPLNFVNNFSDVSNELIGEMTNELEKGNTAEALAIAEDVKQNLEKILHHGKRADGIVKGMLQHSRTSTGQKELTDINALCDEYLRLAYHGLRAKDKSFNAKFETHFDEQLEKLNIIPQDIGRVILNLINNAFYTVNEKKKQGQPEYEPVVMVRTRKSNGTVEISVKDNGNGIPDAVKEKIFQPFFTTKPTGQGTGLGLSLSYDIVKAHGGELKMETEQGAGTLFIINLPV